MAYITNKQISKMSYNQLVKALNQGEVSVSRLQSAYSALRGTAQQRIQRVSQENVTQEFGTLDLFEDGGVYFRKLKSLTTTSDLIHELADVNRFLKSKRSTIKGLKKQREQVIYQGEKLGFEITEDNYLDFIKFMKWFKSSEYAAKYDSDSPEVQEVFNRSKPSENEWRKLFEDFTKQEKGEAPIIQK